MHTAKAGMDSVEGGWWQAGPEQGRVQDDREMSFS